MDSFTNMFSDKDMEDNDDNIAPPGKVLSGNLAKTALIESTNDTLKTTVSAMLDNLPEDVIIHIAQTLLPNANISIDLNPVVAQRQIGAVNLKVEEKNKKDNEKILKNPNITPFAITNVISTPGRWIETELVNGSKNIPPPIPKEIKDQMKEEKKEIVNVIKDLDKHIKEDKIIATGKDPKVVNQKIDLITPVKEESKAQAQSLMADVKFGDMATVNTRIEQLINFRNLVEKNRLTYILKKTELIGLSPSSAAFKADSPIPKIENLMNELIKDSNKTHEKAHNNEASTLASRVMQNLNNQAVVKEILGFMPQSEINKMVSIADRSAIERLLLSNIQKKSEANLKKINMVDPKAGPIIDLLISKDSFARSTGVTQLKSLTTADKLATVLRSAVKNNNVKFVEKIVEQLLKDKSVFIDNYIRKAAKKINVKIKDLTKMIYSC